ncbi:hypothetical protein J4Q44_G00302630 [Coregonus suidteri]|uniref:Uncharacterized protein n=1 Tax=Coregonus suidteri TaxID=861788 RepID=A0AAN8KVN7_9TELE
MDQKINDCPTTTSSQKQMKSRSKSTDEIQHTKRLSSQKSLPGGPDLDKVKEGPEGSETLSSSTEELK